MSSRPARRLIRHDPRSRSTHEPRGRQRPVAALRGERLRRAFGPAARRDRRGGDVRPHPAGARRGPARHHRRSAGPRRDRRRRPPAAGRPDGRRHRRAARPPRDRAGRRHGVLARRAGVAAPRDPAPAPRAPARARVGGLPARRLAPRGHRRDGPDEPGGGRADEAVAGLRAVRAARAGVEDWPVLIGKVSDALKVDYDWTADIERITARTLLVYADADSVRPDHIVEFFGLLGGGLRDAGWDYSAQPSNQLAVLPGRTHYDVYLSPALPPIIVSFLDAEPR